MILWNLGKKPKNFLKYIKCCQDYLPMTKTQGETLKQKHFSQNKQELYKNEYWWPLIKHMTSDYYSWI